MERRLFDHARYGINVDKYHLFFGLVPSMIEMARYSAANEALSYRKFNVGAALFAVDPELKQSVVFSAGNRKMTERCPKYCAEMNVIDQAQATGVKEAVGIVVAATANPKKIEEVTGKATPTLHPCSPCLDKFENSSVIKPETFVITIGTDAEVYQIHTVSELQKIYGKQPHPVEHNSIQMPAQGHSFAHWTERQSMYGWLTHPQAEGMGFPHLTQQEAARIALTTVLD